MSRGERGEKGLNYFILGLFHAIFILIWLELWRIRKVLEKKEES